MYAERDLLPDGKRCVVGLDLSVTSTGLVVLSERPDGCWEDVFRTSVGYSLKRDSKVREKIERLVVVARTVVETVRLWSPVAVGIEGYAFSRHGAVYDLAELQGVVKSQLWLGCQIEPVIVSPTMARKTVLGTGAPRGKKGIARILKGLGLTFDNDDIADAYVIAKHVAMNLRKRQQTLLLG